VTRGRVQRGRTGGHTTGAVRFMSPRLAVLRPHVAFLTVLMAGSVLRLLSTLAYHPALRFPDSTRYLDAARSLHPDNLRPLGYSVFLRLLSPTGTLVAVPIVQHMIGLALVVMIYTFLLRRGAPGWVAVLACAPLALDAYVIQIEEYVLAESMFLALVLVALGALLWRAQPGCREVALAGVLIATAGLTRTAGLPLVAPAALYLIVRRVGWRRVAVFGLAFAVPVVGYLVDYHAAHGTYAVSGYSGGFLYGRVAPVADCSRLPQLTAQERALCEHTPPASRTTGSEWYDWNLASPAAPYRNPRGDRVLASFAGTVIQHQPLDYTRLVGGDILHYFLPGRSVSPQDACQDFWQYRSDVQPQLQLCSSGAAKVGWLGPITLGFSGHPESSGINVALVRLLRGYQVVGYTPGPLLALCLGIPVVYTLRRRIRDHDSGSSWDSILVAGCGLTLIAVPSATAVFDYRYGLQLVALLPIAAVLAISGKLFPAHGGRPTGEPTAPGTRPEVAVAGRSATTV